MREGWGGRGDWTGAAGLMEGGEDGVTGQRQQDWGRGGEDEVTGQGQ